MQISGQISREVRLNAKHILCVSGCFLFLHPTARTQGRRRKFVIKRDGTDGNKFLKKTKAVQCTVDYRDTCTRQSSPTINKYNARLCITRARSRSQTRRFSHCRATQQRNCSVKPAVTLETAVPHGLCLR